MKNSQKINNLQDLKDEIARLHLRRVEQEVYLSDQYELLKEKIEVPFRFFRRVTAYMPGAGMLRGLTDGIKKAVKNKDADWLTKLLQFSTPIVLNTTVLRQSGWFKKAMVLLASETAIGQINQEKISGFVNKITGFIKPKKKKKKKGPTLEVRRVATQTPVLEGEEEQPRI